MWSRCICKSYLSFVAQTKSLYQTRTFSSSCVCLSKKAVFKKGTSSKFENRLLRKIGTSEKKRVWHNTNLSALSTPQFSDRSKRRAQQLSVVFSDHINNIIRSGEAHPLLAEVGFTVSEVSMVPDFSSMNIKWTGTGTTKDDQVEQVLPEAAFYLRKALTNMRLMGHVPKINFVKDMTNARIQEVEALLAVADLGPDFEPTALGHDLRDLSTSSQTATAIEKDFEKLAQKFSNQEITREGSAVKFQNKAQTGRTKEIPGISLESPDMNADPSKLTDLNDITNELLDIGVDVKSDVYNVDHAAMMSKIKQSVKHKSRGFKDVSTNSDTTKTDSKKFISTKDISSDKQASKGKSEKSIRRKMLAAEQQKLSLQSFQEKLDDIDFEKHDNSNSDYVVQSEDCK